MTENLDELYKLAREYEDYVIRCSNDGIKPDLYDDWLWDKKKDYTDRHTTVEFKEYD